MVFRSFRAFWDEPTRICLTLDAQFDHSQLYFTLEDYQGQAQDLTILDSKVEEQTLVYQLEVDRLNLGDYYWIYDQDRNKALLEYRHIVQNPVFDEAFTYDGDDLGSSYTPTATSFKLWAPISEQVLVQVYQDKQALTQALTRQSCGVWAATISGDWEGARYHYLHKVNGQWQEVHDPYALSSTTNSGDSFVLDFHKITRPIQRAKTQIPMTQAVIYEMSVRDFTWQEEAGFKQAGKFLGLTESPVFHGRKIGLDYLKYLGITHVQLMPLYDFGSVDEKHPSWTYNWGYDPVQYNVPEGSFATNPENPYSRIVELQEMIASYHTADISVIMDVVYNHVYNADTFAFEKIVPGYAYRLNQEGFRTNGTFCGNDMASERSMMRRYMIQSVKQWVSLYGMDGFRFDLMGILDTQTLNHIAKELQAIYPNIYLYGEGWRMDTGLPNDLLGHQYNAQNLPNYGFFSDDFRNIIKALAAQPDLAKDRNVQETVAKIITANIGAYGQTHFTQPHQALNYTECHDNATVFDYLLLENPQLTDQDRKQAARLGLHLILLSQGMPFIHSGQEVFRTKKGIDNSYNSPDSINQFDWKRVIDHTADVDFVKKLIAFRKAHPILSLTSTEDIQHTCKIDWLENGLLRYQLCDEKDKLTILINFSQEPLDYPASDKQVLLHSAPLETVGENLVISGQSFAIFN